MIITNMKTMLDRWEEQCSGFSARVQELYDAMVERGPKYVDDWMLFSDQMIDKLEQLILEEYDAWRISTGCIPLFKSTVRKGKDVLLEKLRVQREVDVIAYHRYMTK